MKPTVVHPVFFSPTGTSRKIATALSEAFRGYGENAPSCTPVDLTHTEPSARTFARDAVAIFAAPVYGGRVAPEALRRMESLRGDRTPAAVVVVYGNRAFGKAADELARFVAERGFVPVAAAAFVGEHSYSTPATPIAAGRPDAQDLARTAAFGVRVRVKVESLSADNPEAGRIDASKLRAPRTALLSQLRFIGFVLGYRRRQKAHPVVLLPACDDAACTHCGRCAALCPTTAIVRGDETRTDPARCIRCNACVKGCPVGARTFTTPFAEVLARNFARRKPSTTLL